MLRIVENYKQIDKKQKHFFLIKNVWLTRVLFLNEKYQNTKNENISNIIYLSIDSYRFYRIESVFVNSPVYCVGDAQKMFLTMISA